MTGRATVHIVDDDAAIRDALAWLLASRGLATQAWDSGEAILAALPLAEPACIILDVRMTGLSGPEVFARLRAAGCEAPVIFLTGHADVPVAVQALKTGAFDFVEKPFNDNQIVDLALAAIAARAEARAVQEAQRLLAERLAALTAREHEVLVLMLEGLPNKQIADRLAIATRTVEVHRARVLHKTGARNALELAAQCALAGVTLASPRAG